MRHERCRSRRKRYVIICSVASPFHSAPPTPTPRTPAPCPLQKRPRRRSSPHLPRPRHKASCSKLWRNGRSPPKAKRAACPNHSSSLPRRIRRTRSAPFRCPNRNSTAFSCVSSWATPIRPPHIAPPLAALTRQAAASYAELRYGPCGEGQSAHLVNLKRCLRQLERTQRHYATEP